MSWQFEHLQKYCTAMFESHCEYILGMYFEPYFRALRKNHEKQVYAVDPNKCILIIDDRPSYQVRFTVLNTLLMTNFRYKCLLYTTASEADSMHSLVADVSDFVEIVDLSRFGVDDISQSSYNQIVKSSAFWSSISSSSVLLVQSDSLLIEPLPDYFFEFDYIGAPWSPGKFQGFDFPCYSEKGQYSYTEKWVSIQFNPKSVVENGKTILIGNGGFSIRNVRCMNLISSSDLSEQSEPEDVYFARNIQKYSDKIPNLSDAKRFSCESSYSYSYGSHQIYSWLPFNEQAKIYERHVKHVAALTVI